MWTTTVNSVKSYNCTTFSAVVARTLVFVSTLEAPQDHCLAVIALVLKNGLSYNCITVVFCIEIYQNIENEDEIYANDIQLPPTVSSAVAMETADGIYSNQEDGEVQELYQNVNEVSQTDDRQQHRPPLSRDEDDQPIYQNVERKPTPAPKATRRF